MSQSKLPTIGFDRFVEYDWVEHALHLAYAGETVNQLKSWLNQRIEGKESARKTANLLTNLWLREYEETARVRNQALSIYPDLVGDERLVLHWGMALTNFSLFRNVSSIMGKLVHLQGYFRKGELTQRLSEIYPNQGTIPRSANRIIQSLENWKVLSANQDGTYSTCQTKKIANQSRENFLGERQK